MARRKKAPKGVVTSPEGGALKVLTLQPVLDIGGDISQYYANHVEINFTVHDFWLSAGRMPARLRPEQIEALIEAPILRVPADVQLVIPPSLIVGLIRALSTAKEQYESQFGIALKEIVGGPNE